MKRSNRYSIPWCARCAALIMLLTAMPAGAFAQEGLTPLRGNINYLLGDLNAPVASASGAHRQSAAASLQIPFLEDFSYAPLNSYPSSKFWSDSTVYVNSGFPIAPPSIGVATFDGLNKHGYPHRTDITNMNLSYDADTLTSQPVDLYVVAATSKTLQPSDSVGLMFFYQARGYGDPPESTDSLIVDLFKPRQNMWQKRVWFKTGIAAPGPTDTTFKRVIVRISDTAYFHDGFRFRFRNKATTAGNFDLWHVDYVYLNLNLTDANTTAFDDITFSHVPGPFLRSFAAMPWQQYSYDDMAERVSVRIKNNNAAGSAPVNMSYEHKVYSAQTGSLLHAYNGGPANLIPFNTIGYSTVQAHSRPVVSNSYSFALLNDSTDLRITHFLYRSGIGGNEFIRENDTVVQFQRFRNYYALDDGSSEAGYYVNGKGARMAVRIKLNRPDTLRAARIYFDPAGEIIAAESYEFRIQVWTAAGGGPTGLLYQDSIMKVKYFKTGFKGVPEYKLTTALPLPPGEYFVGIQQRVEAGKYIVVGFDRNYDFRKQLYYDSGSGWTQSGIAGSLMLRPVLGSFVPPPVGLYEDNSTLSMMGFPNPGSTELTIRAPGASLFSLRNLLGQELAAGPLADGGETVNTSLLPAGIYLLTVSGSGGRSAQEKIIILH